MRGGIGLVGMLMLAGCSGFFQPDRAVFEADVLAAHPVGTPLAVLDADLRAQGFRLGGPAFVPLRPGDLGQCHERALNYGVGTSWRHVCFEADEAGMIAAIEVVAYGAGV